MANETLQYDFVGAEADHAASNSKSRKSDCLSTWLRRQASLIAWPRRYGNCVPRCIRAFVPAPSSLLLLSSSSLCSTACSPLPESLSPARRYLSSPCPLPVAQRPTRFCVETLALLVAMGRAARARFSAVAKQHVLKSVRICPSRSSPF